MNDDSELLEVKDLCVEFDSDRGSVKAVDEVSFDVHSGETVCLVGESGSGKTATCEAITRLTDDASLAGTVQFDGENLMAASDQRLRQVRGARVGYVFQNPGNALDPVYSIGQQLTEAVQEHRDVPREAARERAVDLLDAVDIPNADARVDEYPHQFSGGMKQRVVVALALAADPDLLVADEPTTALDVTTEAGLLALLEDLQAERDLAILFVTHDLGVVAGIADRVVVMYAGKVMERGSVRDVFERPSHPYTTALLRCLPGSGGLEPIGGSLPDPTNPPDGCRFHPRCSHAVPACRDGEQPPEYRVGGRTGGDRHVHQASCVFHAEGRDSNEVLGGGIRHPPTDSGDPVSSAHNGRRSTHGDGDGE